MIFASMGLSAARAGAVDPQITAAVTPMDASTRFMIVSFQKLSFGRSLVLDVAVLLDVLLKLRAEGLKKEEADKAGSGDLAGTSTEDLRDRVDDHHEGDEGEDDDEHNDAAEGFHCSGCLSVRAKPITRVRGYRVRGSQFWDFLYAFLRARLGSRAQQTPKKPSMIPKVYMVGVLS